MGQAVELAGGRGYLALPPGTGPGLILLHEWWGLVDHIRSVCDRFAAAGFVVLAPDLYRGRTAATADDARALLQRLEEGPVTETLQAAAAFLGLHPCVNAPKVGVLGFCMGGRLALYAGCRVSGIGAVVDFYGGANPPFPIDPTTLQAPFFGLFAGRDRTVSRQSVEALQQTLREGRKHCELALYPEACHAFFNDSRPEVYDRAAAEDACLRAVAFLRKFLVPRDSRSEVGGT